MKYSILYKALASIHEVLEDSDEGELDSIQLNDLGVATITLNQLVGNKVQTIDDAVKEVQSEPAVVEDDELDELGDVEEAPDADPLTDDAYELLKDESKPGPALLRSKLRIGKDRAQNIYNDLVKTGRIIKPKRTARKKKADRPLNELIAELPKGSDLVVHPWLQPLAYLDVDRRQLYTDGVDPSTTLVNKDITRAAKAGADTVLIDAFIKGENAKIVTLDSPIEKITDKMQKTIDVANGYFNDDGKLFDFVVRNGMNADTIRDLVKMAKTIKANA